MPINFITFGGKVLPCTVERFPDIKKAKRKFRQYNIPGRNGDVFFQADAWENVIQAYEIYAGDERGGSQEPWTDLAAYLYLNGYQELRDTYDPDHFRKAIFNGPVDVDNSWNTHGRATIEFNCRPERYRNDGRKSISYEHQAAAIEWMAYDDLSNYTKSAYTSLNEPDVWVIKLPEDGQAKVIEPGWPDDGDWKCYTLSSSAPDVSTGGANGQTKWNYVNASLAYKYMTVPDIYYDSVPVIKINGETIGAAASLENKYMPSFPDIILHNVASYAGEKVAFQINNKTVYIEYEAGSPYYFIDTENFSVTCAQTVDGDRILANNVYMSADMKLEHGTNEIFTSPYYDAVIVPNWWEL